MTQFTACVAIVGSRTFSDLKQVTQFVDDLPSGTLVISGGARGVDQTAAVAARAAGLPIKEYLADWERYGKAAGYHRNAELIAAVQRQQGRVVAFAARDPQTGDITAGTCLTISLARRAGIPCEIWESRIPVELTTLLDVLAKRVAHVHGAPTGYRREALQKRLYEPAAAVMEQRDALVVKLDTGWDWLTAHEDADNEARWLGWLASYEACCDALVAAKAVL